ncbi:MAG: SCO family protein [Trueperaceae bacterium]
MSRLAWLSLFVAAAVLLAAGAFFFFMRSPAPVAGTELTNPVLVSGLDLVNQRGQSVDLAADFGGDVTLVFFGYTRCPDVCPLTMARLAQAYQNLPDTEGLSVVMVTVDPGHDTPEVLGDYVSRFHPDFVGLTGNNSQVAEAAKAFYVGFAGEAPTVAHTDMVVVLDRQGNMRYMYGQEAVISIGEDLPGLLRRL